MALIIFSMRSIGLLRQNQTPWPPYRTPQKHHPAYRDPCRALLTKLFHAVVWHCLYRSTVYRDISEHTLSLLVYLLDQAWICYNNQSVVSDNKTTNLQQPMESDTWNSGERSQQNSKFDTDDNIHPKRRIKITTVDAINYCCDNDANKGKNKNSTLLLDRWYDNDDLVQNLCTTISHIELPPPFYHYYFGPATDETTNSTAASTMATNLFDYFTSSVAAAAAAAAAASSSSPITVSHNFEPGKIMISLFFLLKKNKLSVIRHT